MCSVYIVPCVRIPTLPTTYSGAHDEKTGNLQTGLIVFLSSFAFSFWVTHQGFAFTTWFDVG